MVNILIIFFVLQVADAATTVVALRLGGAEDNPLIQMFMSIGPVAGLILAKTLVLLIAFGCALSSRARVLRGANVVFTGIVAWNLIVIARLLA
jgi:hypothetical protein